MAERRQVRLHGRTKPHEERNAEERVPDRDLEQTRDVSGEVRQFPEIEIVAERSRNRTAQWQVPCRSGVLLKRWRFDDLGS